MKQRRSDEDTLKEAKFAAYLFASGLSQKEIARYLLWSPATIARRLDLAREKGILSRRPAVNLSEEEIREFSLFPLQRNLREALHAAVGKYYVREIIIVPSDKKETPEDEVNIRRVGEAAALRLRQHLAGGKMQRVGVSWGRTVRATAQAAQGLPPLAEDQATARKKMAQVEWIPLAGDLLLPHEKGAYPLAASTLAAEFAQAFMGDLPQNQRYLGAPAYIPWAFLKGSEEQGGAQQIEADQQTVRRFLETLRPYRDIFGPGEEGQEPLIYQLDTMITGVGTWTSTAWWFNLSDHLRPEERERLREIAIGDLCGRFIARKDARPEDKQLIEEINGRAFVPSLEDFKQCADRARDKGTPGPIIVAEGADKAAVVKHVCLEGLVSEIVVDEDLAWEMGRLLGSVP